MFLRKKMLTNELNIGLCERESKRQSIEWKRIDFSVKKKFRTHR